MFVIKVETTSLNVVGLVMLVNSVIFFLVGFVLFPIKMEWILKFESGLFGQCSN